MTPEPVTPGIVSTAFAAGSALAGSVARGMSDWRDPVSGEFVWWRMVSGIAAAIMLGEIAVGAAQYWHVEPYFSFPIAAVLGYIGPAGVIGFITTLVQARFSPTKKEGTSDAKG